jgi:hypothetical protein
MALPRHGYLAGTMMAGLDDLSGFGGERRLRSTGQV